MSYMEPYGLDPGKDDNYTEHLIMRVDPSVIPGWDVKLDNGLIIGVPELTEARRTDVERAPIVPHVGDTIRVYGGAGWGSTSHGIAINGQVIYYRSYEQRQELMNRWRIDSDAREERVLFLSRDVMAEEFEKLNPVFKLRILLMREQNPNLTGQEERHEVFCSLQAQDIYRYYQADGGAERLKSDRGVGLPKTDWYSRYSGQWDMLEKRGIVSKDHSNMSSCHTLDLALMLFTVMG